jgi:RimJ/RimL family protein N-acetyltransferase
MNVSCRKELTTKRIETERLVLRKFAMTDVDDMYEWASDEETTKFMSWKKHENKGETIGILNEWLKAYDGHDFANWCIELKETGEAIGSIGALIEKEGGREEISTGYIIKKKYWGKGLVTEAHKAVCDYLLNEVNVPEIISYCNVNNIGSRRVMEKTGFVFDRKGPKTVRNSQCECFFYKLTK